MRLKYLVNRLRSNFEVKLKMKMGENKNKEMSDTDQMQRNGKRPSYLLHEYAVALVFQVLIRHSREQPAFSR